MKRSQPTQKSILLQVISEQNGRYKCTADSKCVYEQAVFNPGNFKRHVQAHHPIVYERLGLSSANEVGDSVPVKKKLKKLVVETDKQRIIFGTLLLLTENNLPYSFFEMPAYRMLLGAQYAAAGLTINRKTISEMVNKGSMMARCWIKEEMAKKLICLKIDSASRRNRQVFGINAQFYHCKRIVIRNLGESSFFLNSLMLRLIWYRTCFSD